MSFTKNFLMLNLSFSWHLYCHRWDFFWILRDNSKLNKMELCEDSIKCNFAVIWISCKKKWKRWSSPMKERPAGMNYNRNYGYFSSTTRYGLSFIGKWFVAKYTAFARFAHYPATLRTYFGKSTYIFLCSSYARFYWILQKNEPKSWKTFSPLLLIFYELLLSVNI